MTHDILIAKQVKEYSVAVALNLDEWVPACGGQETVCTVAGKRFLYVYNPRQHKHAYLDVDCDVIVSDEYYFSLLH